MASASLIRKLLPYRSRFLTIAGHRMHYIDEGPDDGREDAPVVILLHGNPTWCFYYRNLIGALRSDFRVIAPDYIGCGLSDHPRNDHFRATHRIEHMQEFVSALRLKKYSLVMHDWGGSIGTGLAVRNINAIERLVYLNTTLTETELLPALIKKAAQPFIGKFLTKHTRRFLYFTTTLGVHKKLPKAVKKAYMHPYRSMARRTAIWDFVADIPFDSSHPSYAEMLDLADRLPELSKVPVKIVWGLRDPCFHREMLNKVAEQFPHASVLEIAEASHLVLEDAPELACSSIFDFLRDIPSAEDERAEVLGQSNVLYQTFLETAEEYPQNFSVIVPGFLGDSVRYEQVTYSNMKALVTKYQRGLSELGLEPGDRVLMLVSPGVSFVALSYAVMGRGAIPFYLDPGMGKEKLFKCIEEISPNAFIGSPKAQILRLLKKKLFKSLKFSITAGDWIYLGGYNLSFLKKFSSRPLPPVPSPGFCLVAFTSGATGTPKGVVFTDEMIKEQFRIFTEVFKIQPQKKDLPLLPIFSLFTVALGVCSVFPPINPSRPLAVESWKVMKIINDHAIQFSFGSPTLWKKISEYCIRSGSRLTSLEKIFMAGAPVPKKTLTRLKSVLDEGETYTPYGATEALPVTFISGNDILAAADLSAVGGEIGTLVGSSVAGLDLKVIRAMDGEISDINEVEFLDARQIGEVIVRGGNVSPEYFERAEATLQAKIIDGDGFWHRMGDLGYLDESGKLYFCGRKVHAVRLAEKIYYSVPTERIFNQLDRVYRSALVSIDQGEDVGIVIEPNPECWPESDAERESFLRELAEAAASNPVTSKISRFFFYKSFPVDGRHNAKIFRDKLSDWADNLEE